jgi:hypothetical protein
MARKHRSPGDRREGAGRSGGIPREESGGPDADSEKRSGSNRPQAPDSWRSLMSADYDYPEELDDLSSRERRRAKKNWRRDDHAQRMAWLRNQRQAEPTSPALIVVLVVVVAILILGLGGGLPRILGGDDSGDESPIGLLTPGGSVVLPTPPSNGQPTDQPSVTAPPTLTTPPPQTERPSADLTALATDTAGAWARMFYTRDPSVESYAALVSKCAKYMTTDVAASFTAAGDSTYEALKADGGRSTVLAAPVSTPRADTAPVDTPDRITRFVKVTIDVTGKRPQKFDVPLLVTVVDQNGKWVISEVSGGTGP